MNILAPTKVPSVTQYPTFPVPGGNNYPACPLSCPLIESTKFPGTVSTCCGIGTDDGCGTCSSSACEGNRLNMFPNGFPNLANCNFITSNAAQCNGLSGPSSSNAAFTSSKCWWLIYGGLNIFILFCSRFSNYYYVYYL